MVSITIRDVPDDTRAELAARAARGGRSMQEFLRLHLIELARDVDVDELLARIKKRKELTGSQMSTEAILDALHDGRR